MTLMIQLNNIWDQKDENSDDADEEVGEEDIYDSVEQHLPYLNDIIYPTRMMLATRKAMKLMDCGSMCSKLKFKK